MDRLRTVKKAVAAFLGSALIWGNGVIESSESHITAREWMGLAAVVVTTTTVYFLTNKEEV